MGVIFHIFGYNRGEDDSDYRIGDIVEVVDERLGVHLPPADPFWLIRVEGISVEEAKKIVNEQKIGLDGKVETKRLYSWREGKVQSQMRDFLLSNKFLGFKTEPYLTQFPKTNIQQDFILDPVIVLDWLVNKETNLPAKTDIPVLNDRL